VDISISRSQKETSELGIPFPGYNNHTVYVWIDALVNYLTGCGFGKGDSWKETWDKSYKIHVIGKNVWKFHAIYWIGLLLSAGISIPNEILIHGFLTNNGEKISKSLGNAIDPLSIVDRFGSDALRSYLLGKLNYETDGDFNEKLLANFYLEELLNQVGNLYPRVISLCQKGNVVFDVKKQSPTCDPRKLTCLWSDIFQRSQKLNREINDSFIWNAPDSEGKKAILTRWLTELSLISEKLSIFCPDRVALFQKALSGEKIVPFEKPKTTIEPI